MKRDLVFMLSARKKPRPAVKFLSATERFGRENEEKLSRTGPRKREQEEQQLGAGNLERQCHRSVRFLRALPHQEHEK